MKYISGADKVKELLDKYTENPLGLLYNKDTVSKDGKIKVRYIETKDSEEVNALVKSLRSRYENDIADMVELFWDPACNVYFVGDERGLVGGFIVLASDALNDEGECILVVAKGNRGRVSGFVDGVEAYLSSLEEMYAEYDLSIVLGIGNWATEEENSYLAVEFAVGAIVDRLSEKYRVEKESGMYNLYLNADKHTKTEAEITSNLIASCIISATDKDMDMEMNSVSLSELGLGDVDPKELVKTSDGRELLERAIKEYMKRKFGSDFGTDE